MSKVQLREQNLASNQVLIAGGGPVGMLLAWVLAYYGVPSLVLERNNTTTRWPKMDLTNARSMELLRRVGLEEMVREKGVDASIPSTVLFSSGLNMPEAIAKWDLPSVNEYRKKIASINDGSQPGVPWQRISQEIFERELRRRCDANPLIDLSFGWKVESVEEGEENVRTNVEELASGQKWAFTSAYVAGCDGASSKVRKSLNIELDDEPAPFAMMLVHFKSKDLGRLHRQGQFWHLFSMSGESGFGGAIIAQDEIDTWTVHKHISPDEDTSAMDPSDVVSTVLGGMGEKYPVAIDKVLVQSSYRSHLAVARQYSSSSGRVHLAGDAAHQNIPTGGYGMNMGVGDAFDLGWKLAAVIRGFSPRPLLRSYEEERRPVALRAVGYSDVNMAVHRGIANVLGKDASIIDADTVEGMQKREAVRRYYQENDAENKCLGVEMGYRYESSVIYPDPDSPPPGFNPVHYQPSTWPGMRAPHVFLRDGTSIFDKMGPWFTLIEFFDSEDRGSSLLLHEASKNRVPVSLLQLDGEEQAFRVWSSRLVFVRPDLHVCWRGDSVPSAEHAKRVIAVCTGNSVGE